MRESDPKPHDHAVVKIRTLGGAVQDVYTFPSRAEANDFRKAAEASSLAFHFRVKRIKNVA